VLLKYPFTRVSGVPGRHRSSLCHHRCHIITSARDPGSSCLIMSRCAFTKIRFQHTPKVPTCANFAAIELFGWLPHLRQITCGCMRFGFSPQKSYQLEIITFLQWSDPTIKLYYIYKKSYQFDMISCYWSSHLHDYYLCNSGMSTRNGTCWAHTRAQKTIDSDDPQLFSIFYVYTNSQAVAGWLTSSLVASANSPDSSARFYFNKKVRESLSLRLLFFYVYTDCS
jgi:hypothetical protein